MEAVVVATVTVDRSEWNNRLYAKTEGRREYFAFSYYSSLYQCVWCVEWSEKDLYSSWRSQVLHTQVNGTTSASLGTATDIFFEE